VDTSKTVNQERPMCSLTEHEKLTRQQFVTEYLKDYDARKACLRIGYSNLFAKDFAERFMNEPYTVKLIAEYEGGTLPGEEIDDEKEKKRILNALWREANSMGSPAAARVAALSKLTAIFGMEAPTRSHIDVNNNEGGVFVVPGIMNEDQWSNQAAKQQSDLVTAPAKLKVV
jgi:hypothetical protein